jgi:hypothetical protein
MAEKQQCVYMFHLFRKDGTSLMLHPFSNPEKIITVLESATVQGRYGAEPRVEALTLFRNQLYRQVEAGVKNWLSEVRFIPKFLISSLVFMLAYFFLSFVVPDPIPVIDELAIGLGASIVAFFLLGKRYLASDAAGKKRMALRVAVDRIVFQQSPFVRLAEQVLHRHESGGFDSMIAQIIEPGREEFAEDYREEALQFIRLLENHFNLKKLRKEEKALKRYARREEGAGENLSGKFNAGRYDFPLYAVYKAFKKTVSRTKQGK